MFKRLLLVAAVSFAVGQILVFGIRFVQDRSVFPSWEAHRQADQIEDVLRIVSDNYVREVDASYEKLSDAALKGMLRSLDPHSEYMSEKEFRDLHAETSQEFGGIGVQIEMQAGHLTVVAPIAGTPGEKAGLLRGDQIVRIDDRAVSGLTMNDCLDLLRGRPGSAVELGIERPRSGESFDRRIVREIIMVDNVRDVRMLTESIGYVRIIQFGERTGDEFLDALRKLEGSGMKGLVIDLRDNPGGLLDAAVEVAQPFFDRGELIVYTEGRAPGSRMEIKSKNRQARRDLPVAVLVNSGSASASEIVAGALKDTKRAVVVGETSFGKGSVQTILPLRNNDAVRLTTALYFTPGGQTIHGKGVSPHIPVTLSTEDDRKLTIQRNRMEGLTEAEFEEQFGFAPIRDRQLGAALDALRGLILSEMILPPVGKDV
ncbi:MAG: S41 family peptidase [Opitutaceae bacterium]